MDTRTAIISDLHGKIEQLRERLHRLNLENDVLSEMVRFAPPIDAATPAAK